MEEKGPYRVFTHLHTRGHLEDSLNDLHNDGMEIVSVYPRPGSSIGSYDIVCRGKNWRKS